jgi:hypothetical protein
MNTMTDSTPWYRQPLVWMLIMLPATVVVASFITLYLAIRSDDGLVEDDYYQRGKEINRVLDRDHAAQRYGLQAQITVDHAQRKVELRLHATATAFTAPPERLELKLLHATRAGLDQTVNLVRMPDGRYEGVLPALAQGHWYLQLAADDWRLNGELQVPGRSDISLIAR